MSIGKTSPIEFLGRSSELETLISVAIAATKGYATSLFLSGRRGTGKTELIRQLFNRLFKIQDEVIPFFYKVNPAPLSSGDFSRDYLIKFIQQAIAFLKKDQSIMNKPIYSVEDMRAFTDDSALHWAIGLMDEYSEAMKKEEPLRMLLHAISAPCRCYQSTGKPVVVMIDDFDRLKDLYCTITGDTPNCWMFFEESMKTPYTPHIITGFRESLNDMFFNKTSIGEHLELMNLKGIDRDNSSRLFDSLCSIYNLNIINTSELFDLFHGNPLYIKKFVNALRRSGHMLQKDDVQRVYLDEITKGEISRYWLSHLKRYIPEVLRADSLSLLYHLCCGGLYEQVSPLEASSIVSKEKVDDVLEALRSADVIEAGFTTFRIIDDRVFVDFIKSLYQIEVLKEPQDKVKDKVAEFRHENVSRIKEGFFEAAIPSSEGSETVAIKVLEEVARRHDVPLEIIGKLQIAIAELLNSLFVLNGDDIGGCLIRFKIEDGAFLIEVDVSGKKLTIEGPEGEASFRLIRGIVDNIMIEKLPNLTRLKILKKLRNNPLHPSFL